MVYGCRRIREREKREHRDIPSRPQPVRSLTTRRSHRNTALQISIYQIRRPKAPSHISTVRFPSVQQSVSKVRCGIETTYPSALHSFHHRFNWIYFRPVGLKQGLKATNMRQSRTNRRLVSSRSSRATVRSSVSHLQYQDLPKTLV